MADTKYELINIFLNFLLYVVAVIAVTCNETHCISFSEMKKPNSSNSCHFRHERNNFNIYFHRFKNQSRHTVHSHVLVWIKELQNIALECVKATVPLDKTALANLLRYLVSINYIPFSLVFNIVHRNIYFW